MKFVDKDDEVFILATKANGGSDGANMKPFNNNHHPDYDDEHQIPDIEDA